jgi:CheY-like chemotaxis protein
MGRLAGGVAHDFNNLLGTILGFSSLLLEQSAPGDARRNSLEQIAEAAQRASSLTAALLAFSRTSRFERVSVSLNRVVEDSYQILRSTLDASVSLTMKLDPSLPPILGDGLMLQQALVNLVQELRGSLQNGGALNLGTRAVDETRPSERQDDPAHPRRVVMLELRALRGASPVSADAPRGLGSTASAAAQVGAALTIAEDIARAHGGYVVAHGGAEPTGFDVVVPIERHEPAPVMTSDSAKARGHEIILVVDDEPSLRVLANAGLRQRGFDVIPVESGEQALELLRKGDPPVDLVVLDLAMPGLSGEKVLRAIRTFRPTLPVIIASGYATMQSQSAWLAAGAMGFIAKPYRIQELASKLREELDRAHGRTS